MFLAWIKRRIGCLVASDIPEKEAIVEQIAHETARLNGAVQKLEREVVVVKRSRVEMGRMLDDTLDAMKKEYRG